MINNAMPSIRQIQPTTIYAMPKNGFFPPSNDVVDKIIFLDPSKAETGYPKEKEMLYELQVYAY